MGSAAMVGVEIVLDEEVLRLPPVSAIGYLCVSGDDDDDATKERRYNRACFEWSAGLAVRCGVCACFGSVRNLSKPLRGRVLVCCVLCVFRLSM